MPSVEELADGPELHIKAVPLDRIDFDPLNPNELPEPLEEALRADIREKGFVQPVAVWPNGDRWRMIDGEHRARILAEEGYRSVPAVEIDAPSEAEARVRLLTLNRLRGEFVPIKLAYMLADLARTIPEDELRRRLGMEPGELRDALRLATFTDDVGERVRESVERERRNSPTALTFLCRDRDAATISRAVEEAKGDSLDDGQALARICRDWRRDRKGKT